MFAPCFLYGITGVAVLATHVDNLRTFTYASLCGNYAFEQGFEI
jgi:hypothetical protein